MKTLFTIGGLEIHPSATTLLCEWGEGHFCFAAYHEQAKKVTNLSFVAYDALDQDTLDAISKDILPAEHSFQKMVFCSAFPESVLSPLSRSKHLDPSFPVHLYEHTSQALQNLIGEWQVMNSFLLPEKIHQRISAVYPKAVYMHVYSCALKIYNGFVAENQLMVYFMPNRFSIIVKKNSQLHLAQIYRYSSPLDVVYYLLKIVEELQLQKEETFLIVSGIIDPGSPLYETLYAYFLNLHFSTSASVSLPDHTHPPHYFTSLLNLAACVS